MYANMASSSCSCVCVSVSVCILWNKTNFPDFIFGVNKLDCSVVAVCTAFTHTCSHSQTDNRTMVFQLAISHFECCARVSCEKCNFVRPASLWLYPSSATLHTVRTYPPRAMISLYNGLEGGPGKRSAFFSYSYRRKILLFFGWDFFSEFLHIALFGFREVFCDATGHNSARSLFVSRILVCIRYRCSSTTEAMNSFDYLLLHRRFCKLHICQFSSVGRESFE